MVADFQIENKQVIEPILFNLTEILVETMLVIKNKTKTKLI